MKILSVDVGIRNLSFCLFENGDADKLKIEILKWDNIDLTTVTENKCIEVDKKGLCDKPAKFIKPNSNICYCLKHSKNQTFLHPTSDLKPSFINKQKIQGLIEIADKYKIKYDKPPKKANLVTLINEFIISNCYTPVQKTNASKIDLVTIGRNIQHKFDEILCDHQQSINKIIIENQIGPIANKMKTIQGMLSQYFIMVYDTISIEFISSANKLKIFSSIKDDKEKEKTKEHTEKTQAVEKTQSQTYKGHKKDGVYHSTQVLEKNAWISNHKWSLDPKKKDDLADCFLQGLWYLLKNEKITMNETYHIK